MGKKLSSVPGRKGGRAGHVEGHKNGRLTREGENRSRFSGDNLQVWES